jgi:hypothetical protein
LPNRKSTNQKKVSNKIYTVCSDLYRKAFMNPINLKFTPILKNIPEKIGQTFHPIQQSDWESWLFLWNWTIDIITLKSKSTFSILSWIVSSRIHSRLGMRKERLLSMACHIYLLKTILNSPLYYMSIFLMLKCVVQAITSI